MTRSARALRLSRHLAEPFLQIHPADAGELGLEPADIARVTSPSGEALLRVLVTPDAAECAPFAPIHWTGETAPAARIGQLVAAAVDPVSGQPESKASVVAIEKYQPAWMGYAISTRAFRPETRYWAQVRTDNGWRAELACDATPVDWTEYARSLFSVDVEPEVVIDMSGLVRLAFHENGCLSAALFVAPEPVGVARDFAARALGKPVRGLLAARPGADLPDPGPTVCSCLNVGRNQILSAIEGGADLEQVCAKTGAGTNCGSCRPEIADLIARAKRPTAAE